MWWVTMMIRSVTMSPPGPGGGEQRRRPQVLDDDRRPGQVGGAPQGGITGQARRLEQVGRDRGPPPPPLAGATTRVSRRRTQASRRRPERRRKHRDRTPISPATRDEGGFRRSLTFASGPSPGKMELHSSELLYTDHYVLQGHRSVMQTLGGNGH